MKIYKSMNKQNEVVFEVYKNEYKYWDTFCEFFIPRCEILMENKKEIEKFRNQYQELKETLEMIMFTLDIGILDTKTKVSIPSFFLTLFNSLMKKWETPMRNILDQKLIQLKETKNGEDKRQVSEEIDVLTYILKTNRVLIEEIESYKAAFK